MAEAETYPQLRVDLGQRLDDLDEQESIAVRIEQMQDNSPVIVDEPVQLIYSDDELGFPMPSTRFVWLSQLGGVVYSIRTSPQLRYLALEDAWQLEQEVARRVDANPLWNATAISNPLPEAMAQLRDPAAKDELRFQQRKWAYASKSISSYLQRKVRSGTAKAEAMNAQSDLFLVTIVISDSALELSLLDEVTDKRMEIAGDPSQPIPVSACLE